MLVSWRSAGKGYGRSSSGRWQGPGRKGWVAELGVVRRRRGRGVRGDIVANEVRRDAAGMRMAEIGEQRF